MEEDTELAELETQLADLVNRIRDIKIANAPHQVGDIVEARFAVKWREAIVRHIEPWVSGDGVWYQVSFRNNNGEWVKKPVHVYDYVRAKAVEA